MILRKHLLITWALLLLTPTVFSAVKYQQGSYKIDPDHSRITFIVGHLGIAEVEGRFNKVSGNFELAPKFTNSTANAEVDINSIDTGVQKRDEHLKSKDFFDAATYPSMTLKSKKFSGSPENFTLVADLTIKDVTKPVTFKGKITGFAKDAWNNERAGVQMSGKVKRKEFNIMYDDRLPTGGPVVGEEVTINIRTEGIKESIKEPLKDTDKDNTAKADDAKAGTGPENTENKKQQQ